jgi:Derlin-2/3
MLHTRALLMALAYLHSKLAPPGAQTSLMGLISIPYAYFPYVLAAFDLIMGGPAAAAQAVTGLVVGHIWWWGVFETRALQSFASAPAWMDYFVARGPEGGSSASGGTSGVHVIPPRARQQPSTRASSSGYNWGSGQRLGSE